MTVSVRYWSWFKDLAGADHEVHELAPEACLGDLLEQIRHQHPGFEQVRKSTLVAVGLEYQNADHRLKNGDEVSLFPPVQGG
jgi:MoaD family protein